MAERVQKLFAILYSKLVCCVVFYVAVDALPEWSGRVRRSAQEMHQQHLAIMSTSDPLDSHETSQNMPKRCSASNTDRESHMLVDIDFLTASSSIAASRRRRSRGRHRYSMPENVIKAAHTSMLSMLSNVARQRQTRYLSNSIAIPSTSTDPEEETLRVPCRSARDPSVSGCPNPVDAPLR